MECCSGYVCNEKSQHYFITHTVVGYVLTSYPFWFLKINCWNHSKNNGFEWIIKNLCHFRSEYFMKDYITSIACSSEILFFNNITSSFIITKNNSFFMQPGSVKIERLIGWKFVGMTKKKKTIKMKPIIIALYITL